jgi:hypothetical protein
MSNIFTYNQLRRSDAIWVIVDTLTKVAHFITCPYGLEGEQMALLYMRNQQKLPTQNLCRPNQLGVPNMS